MAIHLTQSAADRVRHSIAARGTGLGLRLGVRKTGCSGFAYVVNFAEESNATDAVFEDHGIKVFVDPDSLKLIEGTKRFASTIPISRASAAAARASTSSR